MDEQCSTGESVYLGGPSFLTRDDILRQTALGFAIDLHRDTRHGDDILHSAKKFSAFLRGDDA